MNDSVFEKYKRKVEKVEEPLRHHSKLNKDYQPEKDLNRMEKAISEWTVSLVVVVFRVEFIEAVPTELVFALNALHEFAAARPNNAHLTFRAYFGRKQFIKIAENSQLPYIEHFLKVSESEG